MYAVTVTSPSADRPLDGLAQGDHPDPEPRPGWVNVRVRASALNHHDLWSLRGVGLRTDALPLVLGCDAAGEAPDGSRVVVHSVFGSGPDETLSDDFSILSELHDGTFADWVAVPERNLVPMPDGLSFEEAACLPVAYLTAYRMLFTRGELRPGQKVLIQGAGGGVSTAAILLAKAAGLTVAVTSRDQDKLDGALDLGADVGVLSGERLPFRVDAVLETVGKATWGHSIRSLVPGGVIVVSGATSGDDPPAELTRVFYRQLRVVGSTMGTREELVDLLGLVMASGMKPVVHDVMPLTEARRGFETMAAGDVFGKIVFTGRDDSDL